MVVGDTIRETACVFFLVSSFRLLRNISDASVLVESDDEANIVVAVSEVLEDASAVEEVSEEDLQQSVSVGGVIACSAHTFHNVIGCELRLVQQDANVWLQHAAAQP